MPQNLRARLERIRKSREAPSAPHTAADSKDKAEKNSSVILPGGWQEAGYKALRRTLTLPFALSDVLPDTLPWLLPDLSRNQSDNAALPENPGLFEPERFLFFDLETTGLSGGAGTVAFLAAFGRFAKSNQKKITGLEVIQFLLLDYPGEFDFLECVLAFISGSGPCFLTTYNGKSFDVPLLRTRCLMNGLATPQFLQLDLLHPARRLWKRLLPNCSQATVETEVLGLDRSGDIPGAMAPDIWFNFLRSGDDFTGTEHDTEASRALSGICDHNVKDIFGMASLFCTFAETAASPLDAAQRFNVDEENLAMCWRRRRRQIGMKPNLALDFCEAKLQKCPKPQEKTAALLLAAAAKNYPRSCLRLGFDLFREGNYKEGRDALKRLAAETAWKFPCTPAVQAMALRSLAVDAERRLGCRDSALSYIEQALTLAESLPGGLCEDLEKRQSRLKIK